jgi:hypothetical protein
MVVSALPDTTVNNDLADTEREETGQIFGVIITTTLANSVASLLSCSGKIERYWVALDNCFTAGLAHCVAFGG